MNFFQRLKYAWQWITGKADAPPNLLYTYINSAPPEKREYIEAYRNVAWVYSCVKIIAQTIAAANWRLFQIKSNEEWEEVEDHPALKLFQNPNQFMTRTELFLLTVQNLELAGEAFWLLVKNGRNNIIGLIPLDPTKMTLELENGLPARWVYGTGSNKYVYQLDEVVHFKYPNPVNPYRGLSPLRAAAIAADTDEYAAKWNRNFFFNAAQPSGVITLQGPITEDRIQKIREQVKRMYTGVDNAHKVMVLSEADFKPVQLTHKDLQFLELRKFTREEIAAVYGVPLSKLGITQNVNRSVAYVNDYTFARNTIQPKLTLIKEALNKYYLPHFGESLIFDFDNILPRDQETLAKIHAIYLDRGVLTPNEVRDELGLDPVDWGDAPMLMSSGEKPNIQKTKEMTREERLKYWDRVVEKAMSVENDFKGWVAARFGYQQKKIIERLKEAKSFAGVTKMTQAEIERLVDEILAWLRSSEEQDIWAEEYKKRMKPWILSESAAFAAEFGLAIALNEYDIRVIDMLMRRSQKFARQVNETTYRQLKETLLEGFAKGEGERELAKRVEGIMTLSKRQRAATIARTELFAATNEARHLTMVDNGVQWKQWLTARDERVREAHMLADGQIVKLNEPFIVNGEYLMYPGDPAGSAGNIINCRCVSIPVVS